MPEHGNKQARQSGVLCLFAALCAFLSVIEYLIPKPFPFMRLGLANMPVMLALFFDAKSFFTLVAIKIVCAALLSGSLFSHIFLFSAAGGAASALFMFALYRLCGEKKMSYAGLGLCGAFASNIAQLALAGAFMLGRGVIYIAPPFLAVGGVCGFALGLFCNSFSRKSVWYKAVREGVYKAEMPVLDGGSADTALKRKAAIAGVWFCAGVLVSLAVILTNDIKIKGLEAAVIFVVTLMVKAKRNMRAVIVFFISIVLCNSIFPYGKVLWTFGGFTLTEGALLEGVNKALTVLALVFTSRICVKKELRFPGKAGALIGGTFAALAVINERKGLLKRENLIESIDNILSPSPQRGRHSSATR